MRNIHKAGTQTKGPSTKQTRVSRSWINPISELLVRMNKFMYTSLWEFIFNFLSIILKQTCFDNWVDVTHLCSQQIRDRAEETLVESMPELLTSSKTTRPWEWESLPHVPSHVVCVTVSLCIGVHMSVQRSKVDVQCLPPLLLYFTYFHWMILYTKRLKTLFFCRNN